MEKRVCVMRRQNCCLKLEYNWFVKERMDEFYKQPHCLSLKNSVCSYLENNESSFICFFNESPQEWR